MKRFECESGASAKFWQVTTTGSQVTVTYGRLGAQGQTKTKVHDSPAAARAAEAKLIGQKTKKGYIEVKKTRSKKTATKNKSVGKATPKKETRTTATRKSGSKTKDKPRRQKSVQFQQLSNEDLLRLYKESEHQGIKEILKEIGTGGIDGYDGDFLFFDGNLQIEGSFDTGDATVLVIRGDLIVSKTFRDRCNDGPSCTLVFGDLRAQNAYVAGFLEVQGDLRVREAIVGDYNDGGALIHRAMHTQVFIPYCYPFAVRGKCVFKEEWVKAWNRADTAYITTCLNAKGKPAKKTLLAKNYYRDMGDGFWELGNGKWDEKHFSKTIIAGRSVLGKK